MNRGVHLLATGSAGFEDRCVREIMLSLEGISVGGESTRKRGFIPVMYVTKLSSLCKCLASTKCQHSGHVFACKGCGKKFDPNNSINNLLCGFLIHFFALCFFYLVIQDF